MQGNHVNILVHIHNIFHIVLQLQEENPNHFDLKEAWKPVPAVSGVSRRVKKTTTTTKREKM
jgi:hypothetical protein